MTKRRKPNTGRPWLMYLLATLPSTFALMKIIELKIEMLFWAYFALMGISALIAKWNGFSEKENKFVIAMEHICFVCVFTLFFWSFINWIFPNF